MKCFEDNQKIVTLECIDKTIEETENLIEYLQECINRQQKKLFKARWRKLQYEENNGASEKTAIRNTANKFDKEARNRLART